MQHRLGGCLLLCALLVSGVSCTKLGEPTQGANTLGVQDLPQAGPIPSSWGKLVSTSSSPVAKEWIQLWFQDDAGAIRMVAYNLENNTLADKAVLFGRD